MERYYDTATTTETRKWSASAIISTDVRVAKFFEPLGAGEKMVIHTDNLPYFYVGDIRKPIVINGVVVDEMTDAEKLAEDEAKAAEDALREGEEALISAIDAIQVTYNGNVFSGSLVAQERIVVAMTKLTSKLDTHTQNYFTIDSVKVKLTRDDLVTILDLIEPLMEAITDV